MGIDNEDFVHPERISSQLICPICTQVLKNPVQTATEHLFCEDELLEWMTRSTLCPITKSELDPSSIKKPSRIILNMLAELEVYCKNKNEGCKWTGPQDNLTSHLKQCSFKPRSYLYEEINKRDILIDKMGQQIEKLEIKCSELEDENSILTKQLESYETKLRVYNALILSQNIDTGDFDSLDVSREEYLDLEDDVDPSNISNSFLANQIRSESKQTDSNFTSDAQRMKQLRNLKTLNSNEYADLTARDYKNHK